MRFKSLFGSILLVLAFAAVASAQAPTNQPPIDRVRIVTSGGVSPVTNDVQLSAITGPVACSPTPQGTVHNPTNFEYKVNQSDTTCFKYTDPGNGPLQSLPFGPTSGTYTSQIFYVTTTGQVGPGSNISNPFDHPGTAPTTAPAGFGVR